MSRLFLKTLVIMVALPCATAAEFHVSPEGKPDASGSPDSPFATLAQARDAIRKLKQAGATREEMTVWIHGGVYEMGETLLLDVIDSGSEVAHVTYRANPGDRPLFIGGPAIGGFVKHAGEILKADVSSLALPKGGPRQLLFNGERQPLARYPNADPKNPLYGGWAFVADLPEGNNESHAWKRECYLKPADVRKWAHPEEVEMDIFAGYGWWNFIMPVKGVDPENRKLELAKDCGYELNPDNRYFFQNAMEELDAPGEWYLDPREKILYFWPPSPLGSKEVRVPLLNTFIKFQAGTKFVTVNGLGFTGCTGNAILMEGSSDCAVSACTLTRIGGFSGSAISISGGTNNRAVGNDVSYSGSTGISIGGGDRIKLNPANNVADNNHVHHVGALNKNGSGIGLNGVGNSVTHNLIHHTPRMAVQFSGNNLTIDYNHMHHTVLETQDGGAVYTGGRDWISSRGTSLRYNFIHDTVGVGQEKGGLKTPWFTWGIYMDDNAGGVDIVGNIVARSARAGLHLHNGRDHLIENNIFVDGADRQIEFNGWTEKHPFFKSHHPTMIEGWDKVKDQPAWKALRNMDFDPRNAVREDGTIMSGNIARKNIFFWEDAGIRYADLKNASTAYNTFDGNLVWNGGKEINTAVTSVGADVGPELLGTTALLAETPADKTPRGWGWNHKPRKDLVCLAEDGEIRIESATSEDPKNSKVSIHSPGTPVKPGAAYRTRLKIRGTEPDMRVGFSYAIFVNGGGYWQSDPRNFTLTTEWQEIEVTGAMLREDDPKRKPWMKDFWLRIDLADPKGEIRIRDLSVREAEARSGWASWQGEGWDQHSIVADPLFVNAAKDDFRLKKDSPAWKLGFKEIPVEKIGLYKDPLRASWPVEE